MSWVTLEYDHIVKIRKPHRCDGCSRSWPVGTRMVTWTGKWDGDPHVDRVYLCLVCDRFWKDGNNPDGEFDGLLPDLNPRAYNLAESKMALYVIAAGVEPFASLITKWGGV